MIIFSFKQTKILYVDDDGGYSVFYLENPVLKPISVETLGSVKLDGHGFKSCLASSVMSGKPLILFGSQSLHL